MKNVILAAVIALIGTTTFALAGPEDLHVGSFSGTWCGYKATFDLTSKNDAWEFNGNIRIEKTGEYDRLFIRQNNNATMRIGAASAAKAQPSATMASSAPGSRDPDDRWKRIGLPFGTRALTLSMSAFGRM